MERKKYTVYYRDKQGDITHVSVEARDEDDAVQEVTHEYWDACEIVDVRESRW